MLAGQQTADLRWACWRRPKPWPLTLSPCLRQGARKVQKHWTHLSYLSQHHFRAYAHLLVQNKCQRGK